MTRPQEPTAKEGLLLVQRTRNDERQGYPIAATIGRVCGRLMEMSGVHKTGVLIMSHDRSAALVVVTVERPSVLKRLAGDGVLEVHRSINERNIRDFVRRYDPAFADAARGWSNGQTTSATAAA